MTILSCYFLTYDPLTFSPTESIRLIIQAFWGEVFATCVNKKKGDTDQMLLHTRFPWIHAVTWQPWCLSVVMDTSVLAAKMMTERQRIIVMSVCFMFSGKCRMLKLKLCPFYCQLFMHHCNYHDNCHICSSRWCGTFRQEGQSETGSVWSVTRVFSAFHVWRTKILNAVSTHFCPIMQQCKMDLKGDVIAIM